MRIAIFSAIWPAAVETLMREHDSVFVVNPDPQAKAAALADAEVVILRSPVRLDRQTLLDAHHLRLIIRAGSGLESIDQSTADELGIKLISIPLSANSVAEHTIGLILALCRRIPELHSSLVAGEWKKQSGLGIELQGKTLGLMGLGRIGQQTARLAAAFGMQLVANDRSPHKPEKQLAASRLAIRFVDLATLFAVSDIVTIQTPLTTDTSGLVDESLLGQMKPTALLVNVGRGGIVNEAALYDALVQQRIAGAALDVFEHEPPPGSPLLKLNQFIGTPHIAAQTREAQQRVGERILSILRDFAATGRRSAAVV